MRRSLATLAALSIAAIPATGVAAEHVVTPTTAHERLADAATQRQQDLDSVRRVLSSPAAASAAAAAGVRMDRIREALPSLTDHELRDLGARASQLSADPVAGHIVDGDVHDLLVVFLLVALVVVLIDAAN